MKEIIKEFNNVSEFKRYLDLNSDKPSRECLQSKDEEFFGTYNWKEFEEYLSTGNKDATKEIKDYTKKYVDLFEEQIINTTYYAMDVVGDFFDIGAVLSGLPEAWLKEVTVKDDKFIILNIQGSYSHKADLGIVKKNASKLLAICSILEEQGFLVEINVVFAFRKSGGKNTSCKVVMKVKGYDDFIDFKKFGIILGIPFFRRGILRLLEIEYKRKLVANFGTPDFSNKELINLVLDKDIKALEQKLKGGKHATS